jgi:hypothetical protein
MTWKLFIIIFFTACLQTGCKKCESTGVNDLSVKMFITPNVPRIKLGDTLKLLLQIKFKDYRLSDGREVNVESTSLTTSGIDFRTFKKINNSIVIDENDFKIIPTKGSFIKYNNVSVRATYQKMSDAFEFEAFIIPVQKGLANFANYKAEGWMNGKCILNVFSPIIGSSGNNHSIYQDFYFPTEVLLLENNYYVLVD